MRSNVAVPFMPSIDNQEKILQLEDAIRALPTQVKPVTLHHFAPGVYARECQIPAGVVLTGKIHKTEHLSIISKGVLDVYSNGVVTKITAPYTFVSKPGTKRGVYAYEDVVWTTIHVTDETDIEKLEAMLIADSFDDLEEHLQKQIGVD